MAVNGYALITGAGSGIGRETAFTFAENGAAGVVLADINYASVQEVAIKAKTLATNSECHIVAVEADVTDKTSVQQMIDRALAAFGRIDYAVNSAGIGTKTDRPISDMDLQEYETINDVNYRGLLFCVGAESKAMLEQEERFVEHRNGRRSVGKGAIVNITSLASFTPAPYKVHYVASKFAAMGITKTAALELCRQGIRVNAVCPGWIDTPLSNEEMERSPSIADVLKRAAPLGRIGKVEEVSGVVHFLCSPAASFVNGEGWIVDSGASLTINL
ncbi:MAG: hypothetical protein M1828_006464 [Chrysothrix sp. TS-e1954]|nr:MAG: hypothetical protein M1828_006464 [Chrysothrix sp. TS-e1954]